MSETEPVANPEINWPPRYAPDKVPVHVRNELFIPAAPASIWAWLIRAPLWPTWYANSARVRAVGDEPLIDLNRGCRFRWMTFDVAIESCVMEFEPESRIAWDAQGVGVDAYHAWLIEPQAGGCRVLTEESQYGWGARLMHLLRPQRMYDGHDLWLRSLAIQCRMGLPPEI